MAIVHHKIALICALATLLPACGGGEGTIADIDIAKSAESPAPRARSAASSETIQGVVPSGYALSNLTAWDNYVGCKAQMVQAYNTYNTSTFAGLGELLGGTINARYPGMPVMWTIDPIPTSSSLALVAAGAGNSSFSSWAQTILANDPPAPDGNLYVRVMWEEGDAAGTGLWQVQGNTNPSVFIGAFQQFANAFHAESPKFKIVWDTWPSATPAGAGGDGTNDVYYPGDQYVDVISQDTYANEQTGESRSWNYLLTTKNGLNWMESFSALHGKPMAISEWGVDSNTADAVSVVNSEFAWFNAHKVAYENYFDKGDLELDNNAYPTTDAEFRADYCNS